MNLINLVKLSLNHKEIHINFNKFKHLKNLAFLTNVGGGDNIVNNSLDEMLQLSNNSDREHDSDFKPIIQQIPPPLVEQIPPPLVEQIPPPLVEQIPPPLVEQIPPPLVEQIPPPLVEQILPPLVEQIPPPLVEQILPPLVEQIPPPLVEQIPPPLVEQIPPPLVEQIPPPLVEQIPPPLVEQIPPPVNQQPLPLISSNHVQPVYDKHLIIILVGLPKCGKTQICLDIWDKLRSTHIITKFVEVPLASLDQQKIKYIDTINNFIKKQINVIICNGNNYLKETRELIINNAFKKKYKVLIVDFVHSKDIPGSYTMFKNRCLQIIESRTDALAQVDLDKAITEYQPITNKEAKSANYIKLNIDSTRKENVKKILSEINNILNI